MKMKCLRAGMLLVAAGGVVLVAGCVVYPNGQGGLAPILGSAPAPVFVAAAPPPWMVEPGPVMVPDDYVWDGYEYIGLVGGQYYYLGPGNFWLLADPFRLDRFHGWEGSHRDWRAHAIRNDRFRRDAHGHEHPRRDDRR